MRRVSFFGSIAATLMLSVALASVLAAAPAYQVIKRIPIPGDYGRDYLTAGSRTQNAL